MQWQKWPSGFVCFKILSLLFCLLCNFFVSSVSAQWRERPSGSVCFKTLSLMFCNFYVFFCVSLCNGSVQWGKWPRAWFVLKKLFVL